MYRGKKCILLPQAEQVHPGSGIIKEGQLINVHLAICDPKGWRNAKIIGILSLAANIDLSGGNCFCAFEAG